MKLTLKDERDSFARSNVRHLVTVWGFLGVAVIRGVIRMSGYVNNRRQAKLLYEELIAVDKAGGDVEKALHDLRSYMYAHMNTTIGGPTGVKPPIQLNGTYERLVAAEKARVAAAKATNATLYNTAQQECEKKIPTGLSGRGRVACIEEYVTTHAQPETETPVPTALYQYDFASPVWSMDTAGTGLLIAAVSLLIFLYRWFTYRQALHHLKMSS